MPLSSECVASYLAGVSSVDEIDNHQVKHKGSKKGQIQHTVTYICECIDNLIDALDDQNEIDVVDQMKEGLSGLSLNTYNPFSIYNTLSQIELVQQKALNTINLWLSPQKTVNEVEYQLYKAVTLLLKILKYDLSKKKGPVTITLGKSFLSTNFEILSNEQRKHNLSLVENLLFSTVEQAKMYEKKRVSSSAEARSEFTL